MAKALKTFARKHPFLYVLYNLPRLLKGYYPIFLDYAVNPVPRYGYGKPPHPQLHALLDREREKYSALLAGFLELREPLARIPLHPSAQTADPSWANRWLDGLDTIALYSFVAQKKPKTYLEVGSGHSTKLVRRAIQDGNLSTRIVSIDPHPRAEIDRICDQVVRQPLEDADLGIFRSLASGDILFIDNSHRSFMNSDVTVFFLDILPYLRPGVLVHIHDIHLPFDYMPERADWYYSEQYLLATSLLGGHQNYDVVLPNGFIENDPELLRIVDPFWQRPGMDEVPRKGSSFWLLTK